MSTPTATRPRQTTMAGVMVMLAATFVVLSVWDTVSRLRSIETRESIEKFLADAPGKDLGVSVESMIQVLHGIAVVAALCAVAAVALGWQALQGSKQARMVLSVLALPIFVTGLVAGGFISSLVAVATAMLWISPSREWFAGKPIPAPAKPGPTEKAPPALDGPTTPQPPVGWSVGDAPAKRPDPVTVAIVLTIVMAGIVFLMTMVSVVLIATQPDLVIDELHRQNPDLADSGVSDSLLLTTSYLSGGLAMGWSALAVVLALLVAGGRAWAARALLVSAAACALFCVVATLASPVALIPAIAAIATVSCLRRPDVRAWFDAQR